MFNNNLQIYTFYFH